MACTYRIRLSAPEDFDFWLTAYSHGWCDLPPFSFDPLKRTLGRVLTFNDGTTAFALLNGSGSPIKAAISSRKPLSTGHRSEARWQLRECLRMNEDFSGFHARAKEIPRFRWIAEARAGRLLRAPTVFEDVVKMICTTNCTWGLTRIMISRLVEEFGDRHEDGLFGFPRPEAIAASTEATLRRRCTLGYRAPYILDLSRQIASGKRTIEQWRSSTLSTNDLFQEILAVKGVGPYAAGNILKLLGRYDELGLDSWVRTQYAKLHHGGRRVKDTTIERAYRRFGQWRGLLFWLEMTRDWHPDKFGS
jgi:3-methyladenine DNA glycosylase/8-oxoguanine DNA glycosylase